MHRRGRKFLVDKARSFGRWFGVLLCRLNDYKLQGKRSASRNFVAYCLVRLALQNSEMGLFPIILQDHFRPVRPVQTRDSRFLRHAQNVRSSVRYWIASAICLGSICGAPFEIRHRPRHFQDAIMGARGQSLLAHRALQQPFAIRGEFAKCPNVPRAHLRVGIDSVPRGRREPVATASPAPAEPAAESAPNLPARSPSAFPCSSPPGHQYECQCGPSADRKSSACSAGSSAECSGTRATCR